MLVGMWFLLRVFGICCGLMKTSPTTPVHKFSHWLVGFFHYFQIAEGIWNNGTKAWNFLSSCQIQIIELPELLAQELAERMNSVLTHTVSEQGSSAPVRSLSGMSGWTVPCSGAPCTWDGKGVYLALPSAVEDSENISNTAPASIPQGPKSHLECPSF